MKFNRLTVLACLATIAGTTAMAWLVPTNAAPDWKTAHTASYKLHFGPGKEADAEIIGKFLNAAYERIAGEFRKHQPADLLKGIELNVYLHPREGDLASEQHATMLSNLQKDGYKAEIHMLTLAAYNDGPGAPKSERKQDYAFRQVVHEVAAVHVQRLILGKAAGWRYDQAAPWFLQGYDEYLSGIHGRRTEDTTLKSYRDRIRFDQSRVRFANGIEVRNPYSDGAVLVKFLHDSFGSEAVQNIWLSSEPTFDRALLTALNTDYSDLETRWRRWQTVQ